MKIRRLTEHGRRAYQDWLIVRQIGENPPAAILEGTEETEVFGDFEIDLKNAFESRYEFGKYLARVLSSEDGRELLGKENDGLWDWLTVAYFSQFGRKNSKPWHYMVTRKSHSVSLAYRHLARTAFEMYWRHKESSRVMLEVDMSTWGDMSEQLASRQNVAYHRVYIQAANVLYMSEGKLRRGAASRLKPPNRRKFGETSGKGGVGRLALAVRRLSRTYDTHMLEVDGLLRLLPREFAGFVSQV